MGKKIGNELRSKVSLAAFKKALCKMNIFNILNNSCKCTAFKS